MQSFCSPEPDSPLAERQFYTI